MLLSIFFMLMSLALISILMTSSPSLLIMWLVILTFFLGLIMSKVLSSWMMYAVVLLFTGGMMVLFMYMLTLVMSVKIIFLNISSELSILASSTILFIFFVPNEINTGLNLSNIFLASSSNFIIFLAGYLFLVLLIVIKLSSAYKGALKSVFNYDKK